MAEGDEALLVGRSVTLRATGSASSALRAGPGLVGRCPQSPVTNVNP
jgi:hypothetical protein